MYQTQGMDFNDAGQQQVGDLIPANTIAKVVATIRPGSSGQGGWLTRSNTSDVEYLNCEFTILEGSFAKRKFWQNMTVSGGKLDERGQSKAWGITKATLRAMLDSAFGLDPDDDSPAARQKRMTQDWGAFNGLQFLAKVGIEKGKDNYADKNKLLFVLTRKNKEYAEIMFGAQGGYAPPAQQPLPMQQQTPQQQQPAAAQGSPVPTWAR
ncbi:MAG TPA: hypothetical protein DCY07_07170 [Rhodospirillaceae bacterium]|nr:hypothetical protein [Rhodospirillaceae bacterium]